MLGIMAGTLSSSASLSVSTTASNFDSREQVSSETSIFVVELISALVLSAVIVFVLRGMTANSVNEK